MRILVADKFQDSGLKTLQAEYDCRYEPGVSGDSLTEAIQAFNPEILIVRSTRVDLPQISAGECLKLIIRAGAGVDNIDMDSASANGVYVANCPGKNAIAVAELTLGLILCCDRRFPDQWGDLQQKQWNKGEYSAAKGLHGMSLGLIGFGTIAQEVAKRAASFGLTVYAWSRSLTDELASNLNVTRLDSPLSIAAKSDIVSVHIAATAATKELINGDFFNEMREGAYFINTSRGSVVDEAALTKAIQTKSIRAGLDVFCQEPSGKKGEWDKPLARLPGVYGTHHIGASTDQAQEAIAAEALRIVAAFVARGKVFNCLNQQRTRSEKCLLTIRHKNEPGVLACVLRILATENINIENMENRIYEGGQAACARIPTASVISADIAKAIRTSHKAILSVDVKELV